MLISIIIANLCYYACHPEVRGIYNCGKKLSHYLSELHNRITER
jgi:hypothetical protein